MIRITHLVTLVALALMLLSCATSPQGTYRGATPERGGLLELERALRDSEPLPGTGKAFASRVALVVGVGAYQSVSSLTNPANDAQAVSAMLSRNGFQVVEVIDADQQQFEKAIRDAVILGGRNAEVVLFFAGHGFQVGKRSYLLPVDGSLDDEYSLPLNTITMENVVEILNARAETHVTLLDACRNNPFEDATVMWRLSSESLRSPKQGFSEPQSPTGSLIAFATAPGELALDGDGESNSPFTTALLSRVEAQPGASLADTLPLIRADVLAATGQRQEPTWASELTSGFAFEVLPAPLVPAVPAPESGASTPISIDLPYERRSALGARLVESLGLTDGQVLTINSSATRGTLMMLPGYAALASPFAANVSVADAKGLIYVLDPDQQNTQDGTAPVTEEFTVNGRSVSVSLTPDACDVEAGSWLDPQGVGLYRQTNDLSSGKALEACTVAVAREPSSGRFMFQLGRAQSAAGHVRAARRSYRKAWKLGHARAWTTAGSLALASGDATQARNLFDKAVAAGDPLAYRELGRWLLNGETDAQREEGYALLDRALDLGVAVAMDDLARYFADPNSPNFDIARAQLFANAAATRGFRESDRTPVVTLSPTVSKPKRNDRY